MSLFSGTVQAIAGVVVLALIIGATTLMAARAGRGSENTTETDSPASHTEFETVETANTDQGESASSAPLLLNAAALPLEPGQQEQLLITSGADNISWQSSNESVVTVDSNGLATAVGEGAATIIAEDSNGNMAFCNVTVKKGIVAVSGVSLDQTSAGITVGKTLQLNATVFPEDATDPTVAWSSSDTAVATVSNGLVTANKAGTTVITAASGSHEAECTITVSVEIVAVNGISLNTSSLEINKGATAALTATISPANATDSAISWNSSDTSVATNGMVTGVGNGSATITASCGGKSAACTVKVNVPVEGVALNKSSLALNKGETATLAASVMPADASDKTVVWSSSDTAVAAVNNGVVTAVGGGSAVITASCEGKEAQCDMTVRVPAERITVSPSSVTTRYSLTYGCTDFLHDVTVQVFPIDTTDMIEYRSSDYTVADFNGSAEIGYTRPDEGITEFLVDGRNTIKGIGSATLTFTCGNKSASLELTVLLAPEEAYFTESVVHMTVGDTHTLQLEVYPRGADYKEQEWYSSDTSVATVDEYGCIYAVGQGTAEISHSVFGPFVTGVSSRSSHASAKCTVVVE